MGMEFRMTNFGRMSAIGLLLIYKLVTDILYIEYGFPIYSYMRFSANLNIEDAVIAWLVYVVILFLFRSVVGKPLIAWAFSEYVLFMLLLFLVVPGLSMCGAGAFPKEYMMWFLFYWLWFYSLARFFSIANFHVSALEGSLSLKDRRILLYCVGMIVTVAVVFVFFRYGGKLFFSSLVSEDVYKVRADWKGISMPLVLNYVLANASIVLLFLAMNFLQVGRYLEAGLLLAVEFMHFSCGASKVVLFSAVICVAVYTVRKWLSLYVIILPLVGVMVSGMILWDVSNDASIMVLLSRNSFMTNFLSFHYWDYFQNHAPIWDSFSNLPVVDRGAVPLLIGNLLFGKNTYANNGLLGASFMMAGDLGAVISPILWNLFLRIGDKTGDHLEEWIKFSLGISWAVTMMNSAMTTAMLSHGGVALLVLGYLSKAIAKDCGKKQGIQDKVGC